MNASTTSLQSQHVLRTPLSIIRNESRLQINRSTIILADQLATNGMIHTIDTVSLPLLDLRMTLKSLNLTTVMKPVEPSSDALAHVSRMSMETRMLRFTKPDLMDTLKDARVTMIHQLIQNTGISWRFKELRSQTFLAPTDAAFNKLSANIKRNLMAPRHQSILRHIIYHHMLSGYQPVAT
jgi:uncharacterized surface protein with fasciclin (FAS1) repeats